MFTETFKEHGIEADINTGNKRLICPACSGNRKKSNLRELAVDTDEGVWFCHHCDFSGYLKKDTDPGKKQFVKPTQAPKTDLPEKVVTWFKDRGITEEVLIRNKIGHGKVWMPQTQKEESAIQFPYYNGSNLINIKSRDGKKHFRMEKGAKRVLYGLNDIDKDCTIICEGEIDKLSFEVAGFTSCVSVPDGAPSENTKNYSTKFTFLEDAEGLLKKVETFIIATDGDAPGVRLKNELVRRLGAERCKYVVWPEGCKDANEVLVNHSWVQLKKCIDQAQNVPVAGIFEVSQMEEDILNIYDYGFEKGESTGWPVLDGIYSVRPGEWTVVTGIPGHGKSEFLDALTMNLAVKGWAIGVCSLENLPIERHFAKLAEKYQGEPFAETLQMQRMNKEKLKESIEWFKQHYFFMMPKEEDLTVDGILKLCKVLVYRHGVNGIVIDPWNELEHNIARGEHETVYISRALSKIRRFAREHRVHIWVVAHPTKLMKDKDGKYPVPTPYDIAGSSHWRNKADNAITVHRPAFGLEHKEVDIHVQKVRFKEIGRVGCGTLYYDYTTGRYLN